MSVECENSAAVLKASRAHRDKITQAAAGGQPENPLFEGNLTLQLTRVRSFSRPEKLWLKIHTGSSGTVYSYWVEKALLFPNWSSFSRQTPSPYVSNFRRFSLNSGGGGGDGHGTGQIELCALHYITFRKNSANCCCWCLLFIY
jgi:hypothetical protein